MAQADRIYFLVGVRHVYKVGPDKYWNYQARENIEESYADGVAADQATYTQHVNAGANPAQESAIMNADLDRLAEVRDEQLHALYPLRDDLRHYPQFRLEGDGPYQVVGVNYGPSNNFLNFVVYAPWPGYVYSGGYYGNWHYGVVYTPGIFLNLYTGWHHSWGGGRFYGGFYGHSGWVNFHPRGYVYNAPAFRGGGGGGYHGVTTYNTYTHVTNNRTVINNYHGTAPRGNFNRAPANRGSFGHAPAPRGGTFGHAPAPRGGSFGHAPAPRGGSFGHAPAAHVSGGYGHAPAPRGGSFGHAPAPRSGSFGHAPAPRGGSFGHAPASHGSFGKRRKGH